MFGRSFDGVQARTGMAAELAPLGAQAVTVGRVVAFADAQPSPAIVAHEATHAAQNEQVGVSVAMASGVVAARDSAAEAEADRNARLVGTHGAGVRLPPVTASPAARVQLAPNLLVPDVDAAPRKSTIQVPDADHPSRRDIDGEQVIQIGQTTGPGKATPIRGRSWRPLATVSESVSVQDDSGDTLHIDITYRLESRPAEVGDVPDIWIHTERKALLTIGSGEHAGATIVGQAQIHLALDEASDPKAAIAKASVGPTHWAKVYLAEAKQYVNLHGAGGRASLLADAANNDVLAYDDPLRTLVGLKNILKQQHVAGHGGDVAKMHERAQQLLADAKRGRVVLEREIESVATYHDPQPGMVAPVRFLVGSIANWLAANQQAGRDETEDARLLRKACTELERMIADAENAHAPKRDQATDAFGAADRFIKRTVEGAVQVGAMAVDAVVLGVNVIGEATGIGSFDYDPLSDFTKWVDRTGATTTTALVTMVNGFADQWSDAIERARNGDYRSLTDIGIDTLLMIDGARTGGVIALEKGEALAGKLGNVATSARGIADGIPAQVRGIAASASRLPTEARDIAAAMADGADAFVARLRAGGMQMATEGGGGGPGPNVGGLSAEALAEAAQAAKEAFKDKRIAQEAAKEGAAHTNAAKSPPTTPPNSGGGYAESDISAQIKDAHDHVADMNIKDRAWRESGGDVIKVRAGKREVSVSARKVAQVEPDATHQTPGRQVIRVEVLDTDGSGAGAPIGEVQSRPSPPHGTRCDVPVDPPTWLRLHLADGSHVDWLSGATPPPGFRFQIAPNTEFRNAGFSGGHTRDAWTETMRVYGDQIRELPADHLAFRVFGRSTPLDVTIQPYEVRNAPDASGAVRWSRVRYPKSIFEGAGVSSLTDFEAHMTPYVTAAFKATPTSLIVDVSVPVYSLTGDIVNLRIRVTRKFDVPGGRITSWWVSETGIDPRLLPASPKGEGTGGPR